MTMYSKTELATHAMHKPGLLGSDETLRPEDLALATKVIDSRIAYLPSEGVSIPNGSAEAVPLEWLDPLADYIALYLLPSYGGSAPTLDQVNGALRPLQALTSLAIPPTGLKSSPEYF